MESRKSTPVVRTVPLTDVKVRSGEETGDGQMTISGHAAVFNLLSGDLGGFREKIAPGAFADVLSTSPDVHMDWDHMTRYVLGRTHNKTLELREDEAGLYTFCRVAPTSYAEDLAVLMERGDINQMSFKFTIAEEEWYEDAAGEITSTILSVEELFDVCVCAQGAYPQTDAVLARKRLDAALEEGRVQHGRTSTTPVAADSLLGSGVGRARSGVPSPLVGEEAERKAAERERRLALARAR